MTAGDAGLNDPYSPYRRVLLSPSEVRELSQLRPARVVADTLLLWAQILLSFAAVGVWPYWWMVLLAIPVIGTRMYALHVIGHDGIHRRLFRHRRHNDLFCDLFILGAEGAITRLQGQNHLLHHRWLGNDIDPDRHKYTSSDKTTWFELLLFLTGLRGLQPLWNNVFRRRHVQAPSKLQQRYTWRDVAILTGWQAALIGGLSFTIGWWAYPVLWLVPIYAFTYCADQIRFFLEHAHPEPDPLGDQRRMITYHGTWFERTLFGPMNMNFHAVHHLWTSIPYYNLPRADRLVRQQPQAAGMIWRGSYLRALWDYARALPLPECRRRIDSRPPQNEAAPGSACGRTS